MGDKYPIARTTVFTGSNYGYREISEKDLIPKTYQDGVRESGGEISHPPGNFIPLEIKEDGLGVSMFTNKAVLKGKVYQIPDMVAEDSKKYLFISDDRHTKLLLNKNLDILRIPNEQAKSTIDKTMKYYFPFQKKSIDLGLEGV